jgi:hypothetical protein
MKLKSKNQSSLTLLIELFRKEPDTKEPTKLLPQKSGLSDSGGNNNTCNHQTDNIPKTFNPSDYKPDSVSLDLPIPFTGISLEKERGCLNLGPGFMPGNISYDYL